MTLGRKTGGRVRVEHVWTCQECGTQFLPERKDKGNRVQKFCGPVCHAENIRKVMLQRHKAGTAFKFNEEVSKIGVAARAANPKAMLEANRRIAIERIGTPNPPGPSAASPDHWKALYWEVRSPDREIIKGWNLNDLVRTNSHLFKPEDLVWKSHSCKAVAGLRTLFQTYKTRKGERKFVSNCWKGWTAIHKLPLCK